MPWLAKLDDRASRWSRPKFWTYQFVKWNLVAMGAYALIFLGIQSIREKRPSIGLAFLVYLAFNGVQIVIDAWKRFRRPTE